MAQPVELSRPLPGDNSIGILLGAGAFALWGLYPFYFKALAHVSALEIVVHRIVWSSAILAMLIQFRGGWSLVGGALRGRSMRHGLAATTLLIATNWFVYVLAVTGGQVLDASLGYFMCPLVNVALGVIVLKERLTLAQTAAVALAAAAVLMLIVALGIVPKVALFLAVSFGIYGLLHKRLPIDPLTLLFLECALLLPMAVIVAVVMAARDTLATFDADAGTLALLWLAGVVTVGPLLMFGAGAKRLRLTTIGLLQYIAPTMLFIEGVVWFGEPLNRWRLAAFVLIWLALLIYSADGLLRKRTTAQP